MFKAVVIGASTGGSNALRTILRNIPEDFPIPIIILQRIPQGLFAESLAEALDDISPLKVRILNNNDHLNNKEAVLVPGGYNIELNSPLLEINLVIDDNPENAPSISTTLKQFKESILFIVLTGISLEEDLVESIKLIKSKESLVFVQSPDTCFIDDLPNMVINSDLADAVIPLDQIATDLLKKC